jgi:hypothetical protein
VINNKIKSKGQHLALPNRLTRSKAYLEWTKTAEFRIWLFLQSYIARSPVFIIGKVNLYNDFYRKGLLVACWPLRRLADIIDVKSIGYVSRTLKSMNDKGIVKIHKKRVGRSTLNIYELGVHDFNKNEFLHAEIYFTKIKGQELLKMYGN